MYTMVLVMAMSTPAEAPSFGWRSGCTGCTGCAGCTGSCTGWGSGRSGGIFGGLFRSGCGGCGHQPIATCHGCGGCYGSQSRGGVAYGFAGCYGSCFGSHTNYFSYWATPAQTRYGAPAPTAEPPAVKPKAKPEAAKPAKVQIDLPADAVLYANGYKTQQSSASRRFTTPALIPGERYHYVFTVEATIDGTVIKEAREVEVFAGAEIQVDFTSAFASKKSKPDLTVSAK